MTSSVRHSNAMTLSASLHYLSTSKKKPSDLVASFPLTVSKTLPLKIPKSSTAFSIVCAVPDFFNLNLELPEVFAQQPGDSAEPTDSPYIPLRATYDIGGSCEVQGRLLNWGLRKESITCVFKHKVC